MSDALHSGKLGAAQVSAVHALEILECVQTILHSVDEGDNPLVISRLCSGAYEIVELAHSHIRSVAELLSALADVVEAIKAEARS